MLMVPSSFFEKRIGTITGFAGYTFSSTRRNFPGFNYDLLGNPNNSEDYPPKYDRTHETNLVLTYELNYRWKIILSYLFATGQNPYPSIGES